MATTSLNGSDTAADGPAKTRPMGEPVLDEVLDTGGQFSRFAAVGGIDLVHRDDESVAAQGDDARRLEQAPP
jgi:hypothetical protein